MTEPLLAGLGPLNINDVFWTVQGEGANSGRRALFVRMPYCNLACSWCDTQFNSFRHWTEQELETFARGEPARFAVLTGGEPTMNKHSPRVIALLRRLGFTVACESNGTFAPPEGIDWLTVSPKRDAGYNVDPAAFAQASEFKYVVDKFFSFATVERHNQQPPGAREPLLYLSPEFSEMKENVNKILGYIKEHPQWKLSLQSHKFIGIP